MAEQVFKIKIRNKEFAISGKLEEFSETGNPTGIIPLNQFKYKDGDWFILWDKESNTYYDPYKQISGLDIPLSVEWVQVTFPEDKPCEKEAIDLIILLSATIKILRQKSSTGKIKRSDKLKKWITLFNAA